MRRYEVHLDLDTRCNYRCTYCPNFDSDTEPKGALPVTGFEQAMRCFSELCWHVYLSCSGEPLLHPEFERMLAVVDRHLSRTETTLATNGYLLDERRRAAILASSLSRLLVSLDTVDPERYQVLCRTGAGALERVKSNVESFVRERGERRWPKVTVVTVAMRSTLSDIPAVARWACSAGVDAMRVQWLEPYDRKVMQGEDVRGEPESVSVLREVRGILREGRVHFDCPRDSGWQKVQSVIGGARLMRHPFAYILFTARLFLGARNPRPCRVAGLSLIMRSDYSLFLCPHLPGSIGNAASDSAASLDRRIRHAMSALRWSPAPECSGCGYRSV